jgi:choline-sulfatase
VIRRVRLAGGAAAVASAACAAALVAALLGLVAACGAREEPARDAAGAALDSTRPSILLVTLDTTRADSIGPEAEGVATPAFDALAARGRRFAHAYTTAPETLPAHASMLTGLTPAEHGVHENARRLAAGHPLVAERLAGLGYSTAAFVSGFPLDRRFGLARGFAVYDDEMGSGGVERRADATTERALAWLAAAPPGPLFLWVHYFDPHEPYEPPAPFAERYAADPYLGEIAFMDGELGRLVAAFEERAAGRPVRLAVAADHGEGLGEHGEAFHGNLLYQGVMRVPLVLAGDGVPPGVADEPVSIRRLYDTLLAWAGAEAPRTLLRGGAEIVVGEAMKPYLQYGWQPQVMAVRGRLKAIRSGEVEVYDVVADPGETDDLAGRAGLPPELRRTLAEYPLPSAGETSTPADRLDDEELRKLASLGYTAASARPALRPGAPSARRMTHLFRDLDIASGRFVRGEYAAAVPVLERILSEDPGNPAALLRLAVAHSSLGRDREAEEAFAGLARVDPQSIDLAHYRAMHLLRAGRAEEAAPLFERVLAEMPERLPALEALALVRERQGRPADAAELLARAVAVGGASAGRLLRLGELRMGLGETSAAIAAFERARDLQGADFAHHLELGVLYLAARRLDAARDALDRVPPAHPGRAMALFKRAQVAVLLGEADRAERIRAARREADATTRELIEREPLFRGEGTR